LNKQELLTELKNRTTAHREQVVNFQSFSKNQLNYRTNPDSWTLLENIEHLNLYAEFYVPVIEQTIKQSKKTDTKTFTPGWLGNKFAISMLPRSKMKAINTFKSKNPINSDLTAETLKTFFEYLDRLDLALDKCKAISLNKYTSITIPLLKIKLGDTLRVVVYHHERHMKQIDKLLKSIK